MNIRWSTSDGERNNTVQNYAQQMHAYRHGNRSKKQHPHKIRSASTERRFFQVATVAGPSTNIHYSLTSCEDRRIAHRAHLHEEQIEQKVDAKRADKEKVGQ